MITFTGIHTYTQTKTTLFVMIARRYGLLGAALGLLTACGGGGSSVSDKLPSEATLPAHLTLVLPETQDSEPYPVVLFLQGSSGTNHRAEKWADWFSEAGMASVLIDSAKFRGTDGLWNISATELAQDYGDALNALTNDPRINTQHYAVMGFSRGGGAALVRLNEFTPARVAIAFYPGGQGYCPNFQQSPTQVHIFYGDADDWGDYQGTRAACENTAIAYSNVTFHLVPGAGHGFDGDWSGKWIHPCCGTFTSVANPRATAAVRDELIPILTEAFQ